MIEDLVDFSGRDGLQCYEQAEPGFAEFDYALNAVISAGDVLKIRGEANANAITHRGAVGGFMGHVLVVVSDPVPIWAGSVESLRYEEFWPRGVNCVWRVSTIEGSSAVCGLHEAQLLLYIAASRKLFAIGEERGDCAVRFEECEQVDVWQPPPELRSCHFRSDFIHAVLNDMRGNQKDWSWSTAVRAFLRDGGLWQQAEHPITMEEVQEAWNVAPICTSIVIRFWQQYLEKLALHTFVDPLTLILKFMPLRADRVLPGELCIAMIECGWSTWERVPVQSIMAFQPPPCVIRF
jgi:hypothetical protein